MLLGKATKYGGGIVLYGDYYDLESLYNTVHEISKKSPIQGALNDVMLGFAYDIRKAYQKEREEKNFGSDEYDKVVYRGERILWPTFLFQIALLRWSASFQPTNRGQQANLYRIEHCAETALYEYDPLIARHCMAWLDSFHGESDDCLALYIEEVDYNYVCEGKVGKHRFKKLPEALYSLSVFAPSFIDFKKQIDLAMINENCRIKDLIDTREWPDFKW